MDDEKHKLGLPFEYQQMHEYFDAHNINEDTQAKNSFIERLLKEQKVKTVLDMTYGTGSNNPRCVRIVKKREAGCHV